jgi:hypothetical protein
MSPLEGNPKSLSNNNLASTDSVVDKKTDNDGPRTAQSQFRIDASNLPPDLAELVAVWPELPEHIKAAIKALIEIRKEEKA